MGTDTDYTLEWQDEGYYHVSPPPKKMRRLEDELKRLRSYSYRENSEKTLKLFFCCKLSY